MRLTCRISCFVLWLAIESLMVLRITLTQSMWRKYCISTQNAPRFPSPINTAYSFSRYSQLLSVLYHSLHNQNSATMRLSNCLILGLLVEIGLGQSLIEVGIRKWPRAIPANTSVVPSTTKSTGETQGSGTRSTTLSGASSSPTGPSVEVDLGGATLGDHSKFTDDYGKRAM